MPADFAVATKFTADNKMGTVYRGMSKNVNKFADNVERGFGRASNVASRFGDIVKGIITTDIIRRGAMMLQRGIAETTDEFLAFDSAVTVAAAKFPEKIERGTAAFLELEDAARGVGATTEFTAAQTAAGLEEYAKAGFDASTSMGLLAGTAELATNANVDFSEAASISVDALDAFNLRSKESSETVKNLAEVNDTLTKVVTSAKLDFVDFSETLKFAGPVAEATGASLKDMATLTGLVAKAGIRGSLAGTTLKNTYLGLAAPVGKGKTALKKLGIQISDSAGNMRDTLDILVDFKTATKDMGNTQRLAAMDAIFGKRAIAGVSKVLSLGVQDLRDYQAAMADSKNESRNMATAIRKSLTNRLAVLKSSLIEVGFKFAKAFSGEGSDGLDRLIKRVQDFDPAPLIDGLTKFGNIIEKGGKFLWKYKDQIVALVGAFAAFKTVGFVAAMIPAIVAGFAALTTPVGLVALGIAAATAAAIHFRKELAPIGAAIQAVVVPAFEDVKETLFDIKGMFGDAEGAARPFLSTVAELAGGVLKLTGSLAIAPLRAWAKWASFNAKILGVVFRAVSFVADKIKNFLRPALDTISMHFAVLKKNILDFIGPLRGVAAWVGNFIDTVTKFDPGEDKAVTEKTGMAQVAESRDLGYMQSFIPGEFQSQDFLPPTTEMTMDDLVGDNERFKGPDILPGIDYDTDKLIAGMSDAIGNQKQEFIVNVEVNSPTAGTTATATITKAPAVNTAQLGATS